jgi:hypothetical protein
VFGYTHIKIFFLIIKNKLIIKWFSNLRKKVVMCVTTLAPSMVGDLNRSPTVSEWKSCRCIVHPTTHNQNYYSLSSSFTILSHFLLGCFCKFDWPWIDSLSPSSYILYFTHFYPFIIFVIIFYNLIFNQNN